METTGTYTTIYMILDVRMYLHLHVHKLSMYTYVQSEAGRPVHFVICIQRPMRKLAYSMSADLRNRLQTRASHLFFGIQHTSTLGGQCSTSQMKEHVDQRSRKGSKTPKKAEQLHNSRRDPPPFSRQTTSREGGWESKTSLVLARHSRSTAADHDICIAFKLPLDPVANRPF